MTISERDKRIIWHPFTQEKTAKDVISIKRAQGSYLYDENDKAYLDLISSWWVNLHGHAHPEIAKSIYGFVLTLLWFISVYISFVCFKTSVLLPLSLIS